MITFKEARVKHQERAKELAVMEVGPERDAGFNALAISLVESWDYKDENGSLLPIATESILEMRLTDIDELTGRLQGVVFPKSIVPKVNAGQSSSGSTNGKISKRVKAKSPTG